MSIKERAAEIARKIRNAVYGAEVREYIARGAELCGDTVEEATNEANRAATEAAAAKQAKADLLAAVDPTLSKAGAPADAAAVGKAGSLLSESIANISDVVGITNVSWMKDKAYLTPISVSNIQPDGYVTTNTIACTIIPCEHGDRFTITGTGASSAKLWVFIKSNGDIISRADSNATADGLLLTAPSESAYLICNVIYANPHSVTFDKEFGLVKSVDTLKKQMGKVGFVNVYDLPYLKLNKSEVERDIVNGLKYYEGKNLGTSDFNSSTVITYKDKLSTLATGKVSEPLRVRDSFGQLVADIHCAYGDNIKTANICFGYKEDGTPDKAYKAVDVLDGVINLLDTTFYIVVVKYSTVELSISVNVGYIDGIGTKHYSVGIGKDYTTFTSCLRALKDDTTEKVIDIYGGTYDILAEMGGNAFLDSLTGSEAWYDACDIIPPNTHIIGHGNVMISMTIPVGTPAAKAVLLSPINMMGSCTLENVTVIGDGCRYCIHSEGERMEKYDNAVWRIVNCTINKSNNLSGVQNAIGVGINDGDMMEVRDCIITNDGSAGLLVHDQQVGAHKLAVSPKILVSNCAIDAQYYPIVMSSTHSGATTGAVLEMKVVNCFFNNKFTRKIGSGNSDVFKVTYVNTPHKVQNASDLLNIIPDIEYNNFAL